MKIILYFDMDNVLVDFKSGLDQIPDEVKAQYADDGKGKPHYDDIPDIFAKMKPMPGAIDAVKALKEVYDCYILTTSPWDNPTALQNKLNWVKQYFGDTFYKRIIFSHHKNLCYQEGAYLIDDRTGHGADKFGDHHIHFGTEKFPDWQSVLNYRIGLLTICHDSTCRHIRVAASSRKNGLFNQGKQLSAWFHGLSNIFYYICK